MKNILEAFLQMISSLFRKKEPQIRCQFCGETGHSAEDCPKAAKYKLFLVDRE